MESIQILIAGLTAIILFVFGLDGFSKEIERISGERFRKLLGTFTRVPIAGVLVGALITALVQSSSATSVITISLVNAGVLSFKNSVGIIFGANIGTTITAQLVAFKLTAFAPILIIIGFFLSLLKTKYSVFSKTIFYFGFVFFSLNLISSSLSPLQNNEVLVGFLNHAHSPIIAVLVGCIFTSLIQSSSVTTGLAIIFTQQGILGLENAVPIIMGANIGTTATALIAIFSMDAAAKKTALSHFIFNVGGVLIFLPFLYLYGERLSTIKQDPAIALASIHLVFNVSTTIIFLILIRPFTNLIEKILGEGKMDFERIHFPDTNEELSFQEIKQKLESNLQQLFLFIQENYNLITLSLETNYKGVYDTAEKRINYLDFSKKDFISFFARIVTQIKDEQDSQQLITLFNRFEYLFQIHDSIKDLQHTKQSMQDNYIELTSDTLILVRSLSSDTLELLDDVYKALFEKEEIDTTKKFRGLQTQIDKSNKELLSLLANPSREDAGALINFLTYSQRLKDKLLNFFETSKS